MANNKQRITDWFLYCLLKAIGCDVVYTGRPVG